MNHIEVFELEKRSEAVDRKWSLFLDEVETHLGLAKGTMDGDETADGYSLDSAYDAFCAGISARSYARGRRA
jgi:hypothetical protein